MIIGITKESFPGEKRVAIIPAHLPNLTKAGFEVIVEAGAGIEAGYPDDTYQDRGAIIINKREEIFEKADILPFVRVAGANPNSTDIKLFRKGQIVIGFADPLWMPQVIEEYSKIGVTLFAMELIPRTTRAQVMDALSSMATIAGYKAVILAAAALHRIFPMLTTAAGTLQAARVFVVGAGVAGLQAIATARRLGAIVEAYDVRPSVKEQVQSLGAKFIELALDTTHAEASTGYAKDLGEQFYKKQREMMLRVVTQSDVVITTAAVPGKRAPILITSEMVEGMRPGSVIVDLAAERGGNCELSKLGETIIYKGVTIIAPVNLPATVAYHASQMYSKNISSFLLYITKDGKLSLKPDDEIINSTLITINGEIVHPQVKEALKQNLQPS